MTCTPSSSCGLATSSLRRGSATGTSASKQTGRVVEEAWATFAGGGIVRHVDYPGTLPRHVVIARARAQIGQPWAWLNNCEHVAARAHGIEPQSGQLRAAIAAGTRCSRCGPTNERAARGSTR